MPPDNNPSNSYDNLYSLIESKFDVLNTLIQHSQALNVQRFIYLEKQIHDHETRLRTTTEGVIQFKIFSGLTSGGASLISLLALFKSILGRG